MTKTTVPHLILPQLWKVGKGTDDAPGPHTRKQAEHG